MTYTTKELELIMNECYLILKDILPSIIFIDGDKLLKTVEIKFNRAYTNLATYSYEENKFTFSVKFLEIASKEQLYNVWIHELLHLLLPYEGHTGRWKRYAEVINKSKYVEKFGKITRTMKIEIPQKQTNYKYRIKCTKCGFEELKKKKTKYFSINSNQTAYIHIKCNGSFIWEYIN